jgi:oligoribonuclease NrnB/cAMP/cGMP phosphodiesterase (DHH superfamily)
VIKPDICIYHGWCPDGFTAAWAIWKRFGEDVEYRHGSYGAGMPTVDGKHVLLVDFSYKRPQMLEMLEKAASVTILDHHKTALEDIGDLIESGRLQGVFDMNKSGARLAWEWAHPGEEIPAIVKYVEDRDLWRWAYGENTKAFCAWLDLTPMEFELWDAADFVTQTQSGIQEAIRDGEILVRKHMKNCDHLIGATLHYIKIGDFRVPCCNVPHLYCSEVGNILARRDDAPFSATFYIDKNGDRVWSLRSIDGKEDVSQIALQFSGGGHRNAAGFRTKAGFEFERVP